MKRHIGHSALWMGLACAAVGCSLHGTGPDEPGGEGDSVASTTQAFTEPTCGAAPADVTSPGPWNEAASADGTYNHTQCTNAYVHVINSTNATYRAFATYDHPIVPPTGPISGCNGMFTNMSLWKLAGGTFTKLADAPFVVGAATPDGTRCLTPYTEIQIPAGSAATYKIIGQAGFATTFQSVRLGTYPGEVRNMSAHDDRGFTGDGDWAVGMFKGECASSLPLTGVSRIPGSGVRNVYCNGASSSMQASDTTLNFASADDRRNTSTGDWDVGFIKGECPSGEAMTGLAQTPSGVIDRARCARVNANGTDACVQRIFSSGDSRDSLHGGDWSFGDFKGQCADNQVVTGISKDSTGRPHSVLCCRPFTIR